MIHEKNLIRKIYIEYNKCNVCMRYISIMWWDIKDIKKIKIIINLFEVKQKIYILSDTFIFYSYLFQQFFPVEFLPEEIDTVVIWDRTGMIIIGLWLFFSWILLLLLLAFFLLFMLLASQVDRSVVEGQLSATGNHGRRWIVRSAVDSSPY